MADLTIELITPDGMKLPDTIIPSEFLVQQVIHELVNELNLPQFQVDYSLFWETQNATLDNQRTLADSGVCNGDQIKLVSSVKVETPADGSIAREIPDLDKTVEVVLALPDLNTKNLESLDRDAHVEDLIRLLSRKYQLPNVDHRSAAAAYRLRSKYKGEFLQPNDTLRSAGIPNGDTISVIRLEIAG